MSVDFFSDDDDDVGQIPAADGWLSAESKTMEWESEGSIRVGVGW